MPEVLPRPANVLEGLCERRSPRETLYFIRGRESRQVLPIFLVALLGTVISLHQFLAE